jgi:hypothetical protein
MLNEIFRNCNAQVSAQTCCKTDGTPCDCVAAMNLDFTARGDTYNCEKKMSTYVLKYGAAYASEIYHYLVASNFASKINRTRPLTIYSLGCGFSPDYFAIKKYLTDQNIFQPINYIGVDSSSCWDGKRPLSGECSYYMGDITAPFTLTSPDFIFVCKVFSTLYRNNQTVASNFLSNLMQVANDNFLPHSRLIYIDVNHQSFGRDVFHQSVINFLPKCAQYYFDGYTGNGWQHITQNNLVFTAPPGLTNIQPQAVGKTVAFEYWK